LTRKQYPSDHRRYFRVMEDILDDPGYRKLRARDKVAWIDLLAIFNRQRADQTGNMLVLPWSRAMELLGRSNRAQALQRAVRLRCSVGAQFVQVPEGLLCYIPKYAKLQGLTPSWLRRVSVVIPSPTPTPTPTKKREEKKESAAVAAPHFVLEGNGKPKPEKRARGGKRPEVPFPDSFPDADRQRVYHLAQAAFTPEVCDYAIESTRIWAVTNQKRKADWPLTVWGAMRSGWALPKPGGPTGETDEQRYARMAREMEEEERV
jgi:hypothetical protein